MIAYEVFMGFQPDGCSDVDRFIQITAIVEAQRDMWFYCKAAYWLVLFFIAGIAETHRLPFDIPEAESELDSRFHSEYSGMKFGMFFIGEYLGITLISAMTATLFFGGWLGPSFSSMGLVLP